MGARTAIRRLSVQGYRSLHDVTLDDLPDLVVLHGPNGAGKSNLLRAARLALQVVRLFYTIRTNTTTTELTLAKAQKELDLRPDDFRRGLVGRDGVPEMRISLTVDVKEGVDKARPVWLSVTLRLPSDSQIECRAYGENTAPWNLFDELAIPRLLQRSPAYRVPGAEDDPQGALYQAFLSEDKAEREAAHRLSKRLSKAGLFGAPSDGIALFPVDSRTYGEKQIRLQHPIHGELPLRNLGSGEQQIVLLLAQRVITPYPIAHVEEPEAHLHATFMEPLAKILRDSVLGDDGPPDVDQLWIATHHHAFAIAEEFFDVSLDDAGATRVERKKRDEAVKHFYEPSPYWDTLRDLVASGMSPETVVSIDDDGSPIRAGDVLASIRGDRRLANAFVKAATKAFVLSLAKDEKET